MVSAASLPRKPSGFGFQPPRGHPQTAAGRPPPTGGPVFWNQVSESRALLGGSQILISRVISRVTILITHIGETYNPTYNCP